MIFYRAFVGASTIGGIPVVCKGRLDFLERLPGLFCGLLEDDHLEGTHQIGGVGFLRTVQGGVVIDQIFGIGAVSYKFLDLCHKTVGHAQVQRAEVCEEGLVHKVLERKRGWEGIGS